jgi:Spy/CpxP family protein refolding chaperone
VVCTPNININDMKLNKTLALAALIAGSLFAVGSIAQAQDSTTPSTNSPAGGGARPRGAMSVDYLTKRLALTDDEKTNVAAALAENRQKMRDLRQDASLSADDKRTQAKQLHEDLNAKMKDILTPDQYTQWLKISTVHRRPAPTPPADGSPSTNAPAPSN